MNNNFISKVFQWLCVGLLITFALGYAITLNEDAIIFAINNVWLISLIEIGCGFALSIFINKMSTMTAKILYIAYAALSGVTFSTIFLIFAINSILWVILATAIIVGICGFIGKKIKFNLDGFGTFLVIFLFGLVVLSIINIFVANHVINMAVCLVGLLIFAGYIVYDINRIVRLSKFKLDEKYAIFGAFELYLDIINIIIYLLRLFGRDRD